MKIMKGCLLTVSAGIFGILIMGGVAFLATNDSRTVAISGLLAGTFAPILAALIVWTFDHNYWKDSINELKKRLG